MLESVRRQLAHRREEKERAKLKEIEKQRRLSHLRMKRLEERKAAEQEFREQKRAETEALVSAREALKERKLAEKELKALTPGIGRRLARGTFRVTKGVFYDVPVKTVRAFGHPEAGKKFRRALVGDPSILGIPKKPGQPKETMEEFMFGKPGKDKDIGRDILS